MTITGGEQSFCAVVVNYRTPSLCIDLLKTLPNSVRGFSVVVVDNDSRDDSLRVLRNALQDVNTRVATTLIESSFNGGFSAGNNTGIKANQSDAYLLINSDTIVRQNAIEDLHQSLHRNPDVGIVGPRLEWPNAQPQQSCFNDFNPSGEFFSAAATGWLEKILRYQGIAHPISDSPHEADWISFACVLIRREVFEKIGLLDEGYFMYFEDADFCRAAREAGFSIMHCPDAHVVHLRGGSGPVKEAAAERKRRPRYWYASRARYYAKWYGRRGLLAANLFWTAGRCVSLARELLGLKKPHACAHEWRDIWTNFWNPLNGPNR